MITKLILLGVIISACCSVNANVLISQKGKDLIVKNKFYKLEFKAENGYIMSVLSPKKKHSKINGYLVFSADGEQKKYVKRHSSTPRKFSQNLAKVNCTVLKESIRETVFRLDWNFVGCRVVDTLTFTAGSPLIKHDVEFSFKQIMFEANYQIAAQNFSTGRGEGIFYPDKKRIKGVWISGLNTPCPDYKFAWNPQYKTGFGLIAPIGHEWVGIHYFMRGVKEGWSGDLTQMKLMRKPLRYIKLPGKINFTFYVIAGGTPQLVEKLAAEILPKPKNITLDEVWPQKLITRKSKENFTTITVTNHADEVKAVKLVSQAVWDVNRNKLLDTRTLTLQPGQTSKFKVNWQGYPMDWGMTFRTNAFLGNKLIDSKEEYCAVSNFAPAVAGVSIVNAGNCKQEGSEAIWVEHLRRGYIGVVEFYCWASSTIGGLAPQGDKWEPHTESQGSYRTVITKKFLKTFINNAHNNGIYVYAMLTGLFNFHKGLENPTLFQYCDNGQPNLYNGKIHGNKRFAVGKGNMYTENIAYKWGQEMANSVKMFGWNGCRWDWTFIPNAPNDPLYQDEMSNKSLPGWYDWRGITPAKKLYPDPDTTAAKALKAWRRGVEEQYPEFIYGSNCHATPKILKLTPQHFRVMSTKSLLLFEYLLNYSKKQLNTWQKWARNLTEDCQRVRPYGAQPIVGHMRGLLPGTVSRNLAQYICFASGVKWWGGGALPDGIDQSYRRYRFMVRFSEYYFDNAFRLIPEKRRMNEVNVFGSKRIFWQQFVYERNKNGFRDVTVHLINLPEGDYICQRHEVPPVQKDIKISVKPLIGEKLVEAYAMLPNPHPHTIKLKVSGNNVILPRLKDAAIVLFKFKK